MVSHGEEKLDFKCYSPDLPKEINQRVFDLIRLQYKLHPIITYWSQLKLIMANLEDNIAYNKDDSIAKIDDSIVKNIECNRKMMIANCISKYALNGQMHSRNNELMANNCIHIDNGFIIAIHIFH